MRIHHVTAIAAQPQANVDFHVGLLGLRLVKRTVNYDDPGTWHLYYGDGVGTPGTLMTYFVWANVPPLVQARGRSGAGQIEAVSYRIPERSAGWWHDHLALRAVDFDVEARFGDEVVLLRDADGIRVELVARGPAGAPRRWADSPVPAEHAITGIHGMSMVVNDPTPTSGFLANPLGFVAAGVEGERHRFAAGGESVVDLLVRPDAPAGRMGIGVTHHIAWRSPDRSASERWRRTLEAVGTPATPVQDRNYFESIYFREPSGVVFEIATDGPGFMVDEAESDLGHALQLPRWLEPRRERIAARLPEFTVPQPASPRR
ncbi:ring-cleaving dioxygenase [soil metagenome]